MARNYWLLKSEPESYSWDDLLGEGRAVWDGVRNYQARNNIREIQEGDQAFFYHSGKAREVVGIMDVVKSAYPDPTIDDDRWLAVDVKANRPLERAVALSEIRAEKKLSEIGLIKNTRLSVMPLQKSEFDAILSLSESSPEE